MNGLDVALFFAKRTSTGTYDGGSIGTSLVGSPGRGEIRLAGVKRDLVGTTIHAAPARHYLFGAPGMPRWSLQVSFPVSYGNFSIVKNNKEEGRFYNFLAGARAGAAVHFKPGNFLFTPSARAGFSAGYRESYKGGVYWSNRRAGWVRAFPVLGLSAELYYLPRGYRLRCSWERAFGNGRERAMDYLALRLVVGWTPRARPAAAGKGATPGAPSRVD
ncbi:MAG: hypothetical protein M0025_04925 [Elusimicrobia bacterium]|nr:hypothetical protein [Elusimicrobiota bacterium]